MAYLVVEVKDYGPTKVPSDGVSHVDDLKKALKKEVDPLLANVSPLMMYLYKTQTDEQACGALDLIEDVTSEGHGSTSKPLYMSYTE
eukprot:4588664-Amphidinium_carterae.1